MIKYRGLRAFISRRISISRWIRTHYEDIDHFNVEDMDLTGEFVGGNILKPTRQHLIIEENNSFGFNMTIPKEGIELYGGKARLFDTINMSNKGLVGSGKLKHLTSTTSSQ